MAATHSSIGTQNTCATHSFVKTGGWSAPGVCPICSKYKSQTTCRTLKDVFTSIDKDSSGSLNKAEFEAGLAAFGIFPKMQDLTAMLAFFDKNGDGVIGYDEFINALREPMSTRKNILVEKIWGKIAGDKDCIDLASINCAAFYSQYGEEEGQITKQQFFESYQDVAMQCASDDYFAEHVDQMWQVDEDVEDKLVHQDNLRLLSLIRQRLITLANGSQEAYALRKIYMQYDSTLKAGLTMVELAAIVSKLGVDVDEKRLRGLFSLIDLNKNGVIEFDELSYVIIDDSYK